MRDAVKDAMFRADLEEAMEEFHDVDLECALG
jgi:hypothetical protein